MMNMQGPSGSYGEINTDWAVSNTVSSDYPSAVQGPALADVEINTDWEVSPAVSADCPSEVQGPAQSDAVYKPAHYARFEIEPITFIMKNKLGFAVGNVIKYVCRHDAKNGLEDLRKARRYLDMMINEAEGQEVL